MKDKSYEHEERWMLHYNISRKGYGNSLIGSYGGCFEEDIMRLMMTEHIMPRVWMHRRSLHQLPREGQCTVPKMLAIYVWWKCQQSNTHISHKELMHLLSVTLNVVRRFLKRQVPRGGVYGGLVILAHPRPMVHEGTLYIPTPPEVSNPSSS